MVLEIIVLGWIVNFVVFKIMDWLFDSKPQSPDEGIGTAYLLFLGIIPYVFVLLAIWAAIVWMLSKLGIVDWWNQ